MQSWEEASRRQPRREEHNTREKIQGSWNLEMEWWKQAKERMGIEAEEVRDRRRMDAGRRRNYNAIQTREELTLTKTDLSETRQYIVPLSIDLSEAAARQVPKQYSTKRRREQPSDGRERSPRPKILRTPLTP